jgi:hypothetical protein
MTPVTRKIEAKSEDFLWGYLKEKDSSPSLFLTEDERGRKREK